MSPCGERVRVEWSGVGRQREREDQRLELWRQLNQNKHQNTNTIIHHSDTSLRRELEGHCHQRVIV